MALDSFQIRLRGEVIVRVLLCGLLLVALWGVEPLMAADAKIIPDPARHQAFLHGEWRANRPNLLIFIDPRCPYCKKAIPKYPEIEAYNVYVFWSPVLGQPSRDLVRPFFRCARPTAPDRLATLLAAGGAAATADCQGAYDGELRAVNDEIVANYQITYVPAYFRQGQETSLAAVYQPPQEISKFVNGVAVDWQRYATSRVDSTQPARNLALILSGEVDDATLALIQELRPEYLFAERDWGKICQTVSLADCNDDGRHGQRRYAELAMLLGLENTAAAVRLISNRGTLSQLR